MSFFSKFAPSACPTFALSIGRNSLTTKKVNMKKLVSFFEIPTADFGRAVKFYETVLNLELTLMECESEKMAF